MRESLVRFASISALLVCLAVSTTPVLAAHSSGHSGGHSHSHSKGSKKSKKTDVPSGAESSSVEAVSGYTKRDGTVVQQHDRTKADADKMNNWSTKGNVNPETGKPGTVDPNKTTSHWHLFHRHASQ